MPNSTIPAAAIDATSVLVVKLTPKTETQLIGTSGAGNNCPVIEPLSLVVLKLTVPDVPTNCTTAESHPDKSW